MTSRSAGLSLPMDSRIISSRGSACGSDSAANSARQFLARTETAVGLGAQVPRDAEQIRARRGGTPQSVRPPDYRRKSLLQQILRSVPVAVPLLKINEQPRPLGPIKFIEIECNTLNVIGIFQWFPLCKSGRPQEKFKENELLEEAKAKYVRDRAWLEEKGHAQTRAERVEADVVNAEVCVGDVLEHSLQID